MEIKIILRVYFIYLPKVGDGYIEEFKELEFETVKEASEFKQKLKLLYEKCYAILDFNYDKHQISIFNNFRILVEKLLNSNNNLREIKLINKFEIIKQTKELIN